MECKIWKYNDTTNKLEIAGIVPYISVVQEIGFQTVGKLQAVLPPLPELMNDSIIKCGRLLTMDDNPNAMYIHTVERSKDNVWLYGWEAKGVFSKMNISVYVYPLPTGTTNDVGAETVNIIDTFCDASENASSASFHIKWYGTASDTGAVKSGNMGSFTRPDSLLTFVTECSKLANKGYRSVLNNDTQKIDIQLYDGNPTAKIFSDFIGNLVNVKVKISDLPDYNRVDVLGSDGAAAFAGDYRAEIEYGKTVDISSSFPKPDEMSFADYRAEIANRAIYELDNSVTTETIEADIVDDNNTVELGDIIEMRSNLLRASATKQVIRMQYIYEGNTKKVKYTVG